VVVVQVQMQSKVLQRFSTSAEVVQRWCSDAEVVVQCAGAKLQILWRCSRYGGAEVHKRCTRGAAKVIVQVIMQVQRLFCKVQQRC